MEINYSRLEERLKKLRDAVELEKSAEISTYKSLLENESVQRRVEEGITLFPLDYKGANYDEFERLMLSFEYPRHQHGRKFGQSGKVSLFSVQTNESVDAQVFKNNEEEISIHVFSGEIPDWIKEGKIGLNAICDTQTFDLQIQVLDELLKKPSALVRAFYADSDSVNQPSLSFDQLNASQTKAASAICSDSPVVIVHGPPGTGKTRTLVHGIREMVNNDKRILVASATNAAVDHITCELAKLGVDVLRVGNAFKITAQASPFALRNRMSEHPAMEVVRRLKKEAEVVRKKADRYIRNFGKEEAEERKRLRAELRKIERDMRDIEKNIRRHFLLESKVLTGTFVGLKNELDKDAVLDLLVVDEAGQATEPLVWILHNHANRIVLAGDPFQLPPSLDSPDAIRLGLAATLMDQGIALGHPTFLLDTQYRMNELIMAWSNRKFYNNQLKAAEKVAHHVLENDHFAALEFIDTAGYDAEEEKDMEGGVSNKGEINVLCKRLADLRSSSVAIISPYRKQVSQLKKVLKNLEDQIETVDSFQGQEREVIIVSLVRSNNTGEIGFLKDYRRMNVAMTRAQKKLIIIGDSATIGQDDFYSGMLDFIEKHGSYRSAWEFA